LGERFFGRRCGDWLVWFSVPVGRASLSRRVDLPLRPDFLLELEEEARALEFSSEGCDEGLEAERVSVFSI
jgi:hypothetical protein